MGENVPSLDVYNAYFGGRIKSWLIANSYPHVEGVVEEVLTGLRAFTLAIDAYAHIIQPIDTCIKQGN